MMPKDNSYSVEVATDHSPIGGLSDVLYAEIVADCQQEHWNSSPIRGLSLPEFLRIAEQLA
jgi:hypothetical protein